MHIRVSPKADRTFCGIIFDSKSEMIRYQELLTLERAGKISDLQHQVKYPLVVNGRPVLIRSEGYPNGRKCTYTADFVYMEDGKPVVEDHKGFDTNIARLRRAVFTAIYGQEVRIT